MVKRVFNLNGKSNGSYSDAVIHNGLAYISGQMSIDAATDASVHGSMAEQAELAIQNLLRVTRGLGAGIEDILFVNIYLISEDDFPVFNRVYQKYFQDQLPARATVCVAELYDHLRIEMTAVVALPE